MQFKLFSIITETQTFIYVCPRQQWSGTDLWHRIGFLVATSQMLFHCSEFLQLRFNPQFAGAYFPFFAERAS